MSSSFKFLLLKGDYPSINWPVEARNFDRCYAQIDERLEENIKEAVLQHSPDVLCLSIVQYISGIKIDLNFLKELKRDHPDLIIIADATQYIGTELFRFRESGIDILSASCYKWMNAGNGNAFTCFKQEIVDRIKPKFTGFNSVQGFKNDRGSFMGHFEPGHQDLMSFGSLKKAIDLKNDDGMKNIQQHIKSLSSKAKGELEDRNLLSSLSFCHNIGMLYNETCQNHLNIATTSTKY